VGGDDTLALFDTVGVTDGHAPLERDAVGDADAAELPLTMEDGVAGGVRVALQVGVAVDVPVGVCVGDTLALKLGLPVAMWRALKPMARFTIPRMVARLGSWTVVYLMSARPLV
jgi:hypothetical protein